MPWKVAHEKDKWKVINEDTGDVKGEHDTEESANAQLRALYANASPSEKAVSGSPFMFIPIQKVDAERREVWGYGSKEEPDQAGEIMDFDSSRPYFQRWTEISKARSGGKSMGNVRAMHGNVAAGKLIDFHADEMNKGFYVGAKVVDDQEWKKVEAGVYTGFSVGGDYVKRWPDHQNPSLMRYTANPKELSLVDAPCVPGATFDVVKADGLVEKKAFQPGAGAALVIEAEADMDLEKQMPGVPAPVATVAAGEKPQGPFNVEQVPNQMTPLAVNPGKDVSVPDQATLQTHAVNSADISAELDKWLPKLQQMVKDVVAEELKKALHSEEKALGLPVPNVVKVTRAPGQAPVKAKFIKVIRSDNHD